VTRRSFALLGVGLCLLACAPLKKKSKVPTIQVEKRFRPRSAVMPDPTTEAAVEFFDGDIGRLNPIGEVLGRLWVRGPDGASDEALTRASALEAAKVGGTHLYLLAEGEDVQTSVVVDEERTSAVAVAEAFQQIGESMQCTGNTICIRQQRSPRGPIMKSVTTRRPERLYMVVAVSEDQWNKLPKQLRPRAYEEPQSKK
jgi:hypothetical protein